MLDPKGFLKKDLDQAVKLHDCFNYYLNHVDTLMGQGRFREAKEKLKQAISTVDYLESLKNDKLLHDLKKETERQQADRVLEENDHQGLVDKMLRWRK